MTTYTQIVNKTRDVFLTGRTRDIEWRRSQLTALLRLLDENTEAIVRAVNKDLRKHRLEATLAEVLLVRSDVVECLNNLDEWVKPEKVKRNLMTMRDSAFIQREPYGVVLIIGAWNYPVQLVLLPMFGALAAGNCVIIKPSEVSENTANLVEELFPKYFDNDCIHVVSGGVPETTALLQERFDYIFYTGSSPVGKIVSTAAAKHLTPVTLELGGKSPVYVHGDSDIDVVARRILFGKFSNSGQTCIAPDYVMCNKRVEEQLIDAFRKNLRLFYGQDAKASESFGRIVNDRHYKRILDLMKSGDIVIGGQTDDSQRYIEPTVITNVKATDPVMEQEIFGPLLPVFTVKDEEDAISFINSREKPLALYVFSKDQAITEKFLTRTSSGGVCGNDTMMHATLPSLPFGGVGNSGMGNYHGKFGFETFSHKRGCLLKGQGMESMNNLRYAPYTEKKERIAKFVLTKNVKQSGFLSWSLWKYIIVGIVLGLVAKYLSSKM